MIVNSHHLPIADTGDCIEGVTVTVIGVLDNPPVILTITSINPDDSEPTNCPDVNSTIATINFNNYINIFVLLISSYLCNKTVLLIELIVKWILKLFKTV